MRSSSRRAPAQTAPRSPGGAARSSRHLHVNAIAEQTASTDEDHIPFGDAFLNLDLDAVVVAGPHNPSVRDVRAGHVDHGSAPLVHQRFGWNDNDARAGLVFEADLGQDAGDERTVV